MVAKAHVASPSRKSTDQNITGVSDNNRTTHSTRQEFASHSRHRRRPSMESAELTVSRPAATSPLFSPSPIPHNEVKRSP